MKTVWLLVLTYWLKLANGSRYRALKKGTRGDRMGSEKTNTAKSKSKRSMKRKGKHHLANIFDNVDSVAYDPSQGAPSIKPSLVQTAEPSQLSSSSPSSTPTIAVSSVASSGDNQAGDMIAKVREFYLAFALPDGNVNLTDGQIEALVKSTEAVILETARRRYPAFNSVSLTVARHSLNAGVPEDRFNFYLEFESLTFVSSGPLPTSEEMFDILEASITAEYIIAYVRVLPGFTGVNEVWLSALDK